MVDDIMRYNLQRYLMPLSVLQRQRRDGEQGVAADAWLEVFVVQCASKFTMHAKKRILVFQMFTFICKNLLI
jgi:hypothetical protein